MKSKEGKGPWRSRLRASYKNLKCICEKFRIFIKFAHHVPNDPLIITALRNHLRKTTPDLMELPDLFDGGNHTYINNKLLNEIRMNYDKPGTPSRSAPKFLLVSHELSNTGAPKAVLMLHHSLVRVTGGQTVVLALKDGPMRKEFEAAGATVILLGDVPYRRRQFEDFISDFEKVLICSCSWEFLMVAKFIDKRPVIWWVHEIFTHDAQFSLIRKFIGDIDLLLAGSPLVMETFKGDLEPAKLDSLLYGLDELEVPRRNAAQDFINFAILGTICERKGTDLFVHAIENLPDSVRSRARFTIVGDSDEELFLRKFRARIKSMPEVEIHDAVPFDELIGMYSQFDVIVSASRLDPMPIVMTYGLMFEKVCLCPDSIGTALFIKDGHDGVLFKSGSAADLSERMKDMIENWDNYKSMGIAGRAIYQRHFSSKKFDAAVADIFTN